jgi:pSer/pThr/pTyr-binding forkhead associated (FHA) protein
MDKIHLRIGSNVDNDMVIESEGVDDKHLELFCDSSGNVFITDLNTKNGTFINGEELNGYALLNQGDKVVLGRHYVFRWESFVRKEKISDDDRDEKKPFNQKKEGIEEKMQSDNKHKIDLSASNKELILIYGAILLVLILMFLVF